MYTTAFRRLHVRQSLRRGLPCTEFFSFLFFSLAFFGSAGVVGTAGQAAKPFYHSGSREVTLSICSQWKGTTSSNLSIFPCGASNLFLDNVFSRKLRNFSSKTWSYSDRGRAAEGWEEVLGARSCGWGLGNTSGADWLRCFNSAISGSTLYRNCFECQRS